MSTLTRDEINRANARHSSGPVTEEGKQRSARNSFKHGLYSKDLIQPGESAEAFDALRADLRAEHSPTDTTEDILVDELAQHYWRIRRFRRLEADFWQPEHLDHAQSSGRLALITRSLASAERGFHKTLDALRRLKKDRQLASEASAGFVSSNSRAPRIPLPPTDRTLEALKVWQFEATLHDKVRPLEQPLLRDMFESQLGESRLLSRLISLSEPPQAHASFRPAPESLK